MTNRNRVLLLSALIGVPLVGAIALAAWNLRDPQVSSSLQVPFGVVFLGAGILWITRALVGAFLRQRSPLSLWWRFVFGTSLTALGILFLRRPPGSEGSFTSGSMGIYLVGMVALYLANRADRGAGKRTGA